METSLWQTQYQSVHARFRPTGCESRVPYTRGEFRSSFFRSWPLNRWAHGALSVVSRLSNRGIHPIIKTCGIATHRVGNFWRRVRWRSSAGRSSVSGDPHHPLFRRPLSGRRTFTTDGPMASSPAGCARGAASFPGANEAPVGYAKTGRGISWPLPTVARWR